MTRFNTSDKKGNPLTFETDTHGIIRKTFQKLNEEGYIENYKERHIKDKKIYLTKLAFASTNLDKKTEIYNVQFQRTQKQIEFNDVNFRKMFPAVFGKTGILSKTGYTNEMNPEGELQINYKKRKEQHKEGLAKKSDFRERVRVEESLEEQREKIELILNRQKPQKTINYERDEK